MNNFAKLGCTLLIGLVFAFWPSGASSVEAASVIETFPKTTFTGEAANHEMDVSVVNLSKRTKAYFNEEGFFPVPASNFGRYSGRFSDEFRLSPRSQYDRLYGLELYLVGVDSNERINLEITGYVPELFGPQGDVLIVKYPVWATTQIGYYDLVFENVSIRDKSIFRNALQVMEAPVGGSEEVVIDEPEVVRPPVSITKSASSAPAINSFLPSPGARYGSTISFEGYGWPDVDYGLEVILMNTTDKKTYACATLSYVPKSGYLLVQTPALPAKKNQAYDIVIYPRSTGIARTTIHNGLWVTG